MTTTQRPAMAQFAQFTPFPKAKSVEQLAGEFEARMLERFMRLSAQHMRAQAAA